MRDQAEIKDWRGTPIEVGDVILYSVKHSTWVEVNEAVVKTVGMEPQGYWTDKKIPVVRCEWQSSSYSYRPDSDRRFDPGREIKRVKLTNFEGITVVSKGTQPAWSREYTIDWGADATL